MNFIIIFVISLITLCDCGKIVKKRLTTDESKNSTETNESFHINVSAGYGIQQDNNTTNSPTNSTPIKHYFQERKYRRDNNNNNNISSNNHHDQISQPSVLTANEQTYQVRENHQAEIQEKSFRHSNNNNNKYRQSYGRPSLNEIHNIVNNLEHSGRPLSHSQYGRPPKGSTIVEVVRVPAIYELHLQTGNHDAQRYVTINPWVNKMNGWVQDTQLPNGYQYRPIQNNHHNNKPKAQSYKSAGFSFGGYNYGEEQKLSHLLQNFKQEFMAQQHQEIPYQHQIIQHDNFADQPDIHQSIEITPQQFHQHQQLDSSGFGHYQQLKSLSHNQYQLPQKSHQEVLPYNHYQYHAHEISSKNLGKSSMHQNIRQHAPQAESYKKIKQEVITPSYNNQWDYSAEINHHDYYKKPQAIHEVPAPVLNKYQANHQHNIWPKIKTTPATMIYPNPTLWVNNVNVESTQSNIALPGALDDIKLAPIKAAYQDFPHDLSGYSRGHVESVPNDLYQHQELSSDDMYSTNNQHSIDEDFQQLQGDYNSLNSNVGNYLDQDLANSKPIMEDNSYEEQEAFATQSAKSEHTQSPPEFVENHQLVMKDEDIKAGQEIFAQHVSPDINYLLIKNNPPVQIQPTAMTLVQTTEEIPKNLNYVHNFESMKVNQANRGSNNEKKVNYPRPFQKNYNRRHLQPLDYIIYIKERTIDD